MNGSEMNSGREPELASAWLRRLRAGEPRTLGGLTVFPLSWEVPGVFPYLTLGEALEKGFVTITEVSQGGSVPELAVENAGETAVLLLDGEELRGAKQNRVLNTTILLAPKSRSVVPVSCTEQGRWHYVSNAFEDSGFVMSRSARIEKNLSVSMSLKAGRAHRSDQGAVWNSIRDLSDRAGVFSSTGAQRDVFESRKEALFEVEREIPCREGQCGLLVFALGQPVGFDAVSLPSAYARLHGKLLKAMPWKASWRARGLRDGLPGRKRPGLSWTPARTLPAKPTRASAWAWTAVSSLGPGPVFPWFTGARPSIPPSSPCLTRSREEPARNPPPPWPTWSAA